MDIRKYLDENQVSYKLSNNGYLVIQKCVFCDGNKVLNVNLTNEKRSFGYTKCFKCGFANYFDKVIKEISKVSEEDAYKLFHGEKKSVEKNDNHSTVLKIINGMNLTFDAIDRTNRLAFIKDARHVHYLKYKATSPEAEADIQEGMAYLKRRGLSDYDIEKCEVTIYPKDKALVRQAYFDSLSEEELKSLKIALHKKKNKEFLEENDLESLNELNKVLMMSGRILFPVKVSKKTIGYVARDYTGLVPDDYKVLNSTGPMSSDFFWNFNNALKSEITVITEGIFSAISCGINRSTATLGMNSILGLNKIKLYKSMNSKEFVIFFDPGAMKKAEMMARELSKGLNEVRIVIPPTVLKIKEPVRVNDIFDSGVYMKQAFDYKENHYYISYHDHRMIKYACKVMDYLKNGDKKGVQRVFDIINALKTTAPERRKRFYSILNKIKHSIQLEKECRKLINGSFLDANDLGKDYCEYLISTAPIYNHELDYDVFDDQIKYLVSEEDRELELEELTDIESQKGRVA